MSSHAFATDTGISYFMSNQIVFRLGLRRYFHVSKHWRGWKREFQIDMLIKLFVNVVAPIVATAVFIVDLPIMLANIFKSLAWRIYFYKRNSDFVIKVAASLYIAVALISLTVIASFK